MSRLANAKPAVRPSDMDRFWAKVDKGSGGCWQWTGAIGKPDGYGRFAVRAEGFNRNGRPAWRTHLAHRVSYVQHKGQIPAGLQLDHLCRNRRCVNPAHLEAVTAQVNMHRSTNQIVEQMGRTHCVRGHSLTAPNMYVDSRNKRVCRQCYRDRRAARKAAVA